MLRYSLRDLLREPRRTLASVIGVALGVGLFSAIALYVDSSAATMTARASAPVPIDIRAQLREPLAAGLTVRESVTPGSIVRGDRATFTLSVTNDGSVPATRVVLKDDVEPPLTYVPGTTKLGGETVDDEGLVPVTEGVSVGTLAPRAVATVTYVATSALALPAAGLPLHGRAVSREDPAPSTANAPRLMSLEELRAEVASIAGIASAERLGLVDLPPGSLSVGGAKVKDSVRVFALDPSYERHHPSVALASLSPGAAVLSVEAARVLGVRPGGAVELALPGRSAPLGLSVAGVADLSGAASLFASRVGETRGDFIYVPDSVVVSPEIFESSVLPALRADAISRNPVLKHAPILEVDAEVDRLRLDADPATALIRTQALSKTIDRIAPGQVAVADDLTEALTVATGDVTTGKVMFLFLGMPGVLLAGFLAAYAGGLLARAQRREHALLRIRGAQTGLLVQLLIWKTLAVAGAGSVLGLGLGIATLVVIAGGHALSVVPAQDLVVLGILAVGAGVLTTALALYVPGRRSLHREAIEEGRELEIGRAPLWHRLWLDVALILAAGAVETVTYLGGGFTPTQAERQAVSLSFYVLLAPLMAWFGATLLAVRLLLLASPRIPAGSGRLGPVVTGVLRRSLMRRTSGLAGGIVGVALALGFGFSVAIFIATYDAQKAAEARFTIGADLRVTPGAVSPRPPAFADSLRVPGVVSTAPVAFHIANTMFGTDTKDLAAIDTTSLQRTETLPDAFFVGHSASAAMAALRAEPTALLLDQEVARDLDIQEGDAVTVQLIDHNGAPVPVRFHAVGRFTQFPGFPQHVDAVANLGFYQSVTGRTEADFFLVRTADPSDGAVARVAGQLRSGPGAGTPLRVETTATAINRDQSTLAALNLHGLGSLDSFYMALMSATAVGIFVFGLMLQRRREYVTFRALGIRLRQLYALVVGEAAAVAVCGLVVGALVGAGMALMFVQVLRPLFTLPPHGVTLPAGAMATLSGLVLGSMAVSALAAGIILRRLHPIELLRDE